MNYNEWLEQYFEKVANSSEEGQAAVMFVKQNQVKVGLRRTWKSRGAYWTFGKRFYLNKLYYSMQSALENPRAWTLFVHEVHHLKQGAITAISVYGELEAWQVEFRLLKKIIGKELKPDLEELLSLPINFDRANLKRARKLMTNFAGFWYMAWILPLYPIDKEIKYWFTRKVNE